MDDLMDRDQARCPLKPQCQRQRSHTGVCMELVDGHWELMPVPPAVPKFSDWHEAFAMVELVRLAYGEEAVV